MNDWNSNQYTKYVTERTQPSIDLIRRINAYPESILDIGCGPGNSTNQLSEFFPEAEIVGIDSSDNMLCKASENYPELKFKKCTVPEELNKLDNYDLIFSNACLHWIPNHKALLPKIISKLNDNGILAVQMPLVQDALFYKLLNELFTSDKWRKLSSIKNFHNLNPDETYNVLYPVSKNIAMWETTYYHIVPSHKDIIEWYKGSGLRPYLDQLDTDEKQEFIDDIVETVEANYPVNSDSTVTLKMPRLFFIVNKK